MDDRMKIIMFGSSIYIKQFKDKDILDAIEIMESLQMKHRLSIPDYGWKRVASIDGKIHLEVKQASSLRCEIQIIIDGETSPVDINVIKKEIERREIDTSSNMRK